ncbi:MAG: hypothetical protein IJR71_09300 [Prevotella sp.]|nr:hypothetical protein [Prevotella sp.]
MNKKEYKRPSIKKVVMEDLMSVGLHNSVGSDTQMSKEMYDDFVPYTSGSVWDE